jgi:hypothetical protein
LAGENPRSPLAIIPAIAAITGNMRLPSDGDMLAHGLLFRAIGQNQAPSKAPPYETHFSASQG